MKRVLLIAAIHFALLLFISVPVIANPTWIDSGVAFDAVLDDISINPDNTSIDVQNDYLSYDSYWSVHASGGSIQTVVLNSMGTSANMSFGIFSPDSDNDSQLEMIEIFNGTSSAGSQAVLSILGDGSVYVNFSDTGEDFIDNYFGYYLVSGQNTWYSDSGMNTNNEDHMVVYQGNDADIIQIGSMIPGIWTDSSYIFGFEEGGIPGDYSDFIFMAESVSPVSPIPVPGALLLGLIGLGSLRLKFRKNS